MRRLLLSLALALTLSVVGASSALAGTPVGAQTAPLYGPQAGFSCPTGGAPTTPTFGFAVLNRPGDGTTVIGQVSLRHAAPNTEYVVQVVEVEEEFFCFFINQENVTTDAKGNARRHVTAGVISEPTKFWVIMFNLSPGETFASPAVALH